MTTEELNRIPAVRWATATVAVTAMCAAGVYFLVLGTRALRTGRFTGRGGVIETGPRARTAAALCLVLGLLGIAGAALAIIAGVVYPVR